MSRIIYSIVAAILGSFGAYRLADPAAPVVGVEPAIDWTAVTAIVASMIAAVEALFSGFTKLLAILRGGNGLPKTPSGS